MSDTRRETDAGVEYSSAPYLLDAAAAEAYLGSIQSPRSRRANIHNDQEAARRAGFAAPIAAGEHSLAILAQFLADRFGASFLNRGRLEVAFIKPVLYGDTLTAHIRVAAADERQTALEVWVQNASGERVVVGTATVGRAIE